MAFASGKHALGLCERCSFKYKLHDLTHEAGTHLLVCGECNDGMWNRVDHPQNHPPKKLSDPQGLKHPSPQPNPITGIELFGEENAGESVDYLNIFLLTSGD